MSKSTKIVLIIAAITFIAWGLTDLYQYATIGQETLEYFNGAQVIKKLVEYQLLQGLIKTAIGILIAAITLFKSKKR